MRRTGDTFRIILKGLLRASEGETVIVFVHREDYAKELLSKAGEISRFNYSGFNPELNLITFEGGGSLRFTTKNNRSIDYLLNNSTLILNDGGCY